MNFEPEIEAPEGWKSVRIETTKVEPDMVDDFRAEIKQAGMSFVEEKGVIVVQAGNDRFARECFERGLLSDLGVRGFRATWTKDGL